MKGSIRKAVGAGVCEEDGIIGMSSPTANFTLGKASIHSNMDGDTR